MKEAYKTYDIYVAGYLIYKNLKVEMELDGNKRVVFVFEKGDGLNRALSDFDSGDSVEILKYVSIVKNLRNRMYNLLMSGGRG